MTTRKLYILITVLSFLLAGCSAVKLRPVAKYTIMNFHQKTGRTKSRTKATLLVTTPTANPGYSTNKMIYMITPQQLQSFADNRWVAPPSQMFLPLLVSAIKNQNYFHAVASSPFAGASNYRLSTKILVLQQEFLHPESEVRMIVQAVLINGSNNAVVASRTFKVVRVCSAKDPYSGVLATTSAANAIAAQIARFVVRNAA